MGRSTSSSTSNSEDEQSQGDRTSRYTYTSKQLRELLKNTGPGHNALSGAFEADPNLLLAQDECGCNVLHYAARHQKYNIDIYNALGRHFRKEDIAALFCRDQEGMTPLHYSVECLMESEAHASFPRLIFCSCITLLAMKDLKEFEARFNDDQNRAGKSVFESFFYLGGDFWQGFKEGFSSSDILLEDQREALKRFIDASILLDRSDCVVEDACSSTTELLSSDLVNACSDMSCREPSVSGEEASTRPPLGAGGYLRPNATRDTPPSRDREELPESPPETLSNASSTESMVPLPPGSKSTSATSNSTARSMQRVGCFHCYRDPDSDGAARVWIKCSIV